MSKDFLNPDEGDETYTSEQDAGDGTGTEFGYVELPPEGDYEVVVMGVSAGRAKSSGNPQITLSLASPDVPAASAKYYMTNTPSAKWRFDRDLRALGLEPPVKGGKPYVFKADDFVGKKLLAKGKHETYQNRVSFKFAEIAPTAEGPGARAFGAAA